jgi:serine/threonine protein kinase
MSPEVLEGGICSGRGDIWALGIMMLECAKGLHPLIDDSWKVEGEEDDDEEENTDAKGAAGAGAVSVARTKSIQRVKSGQNWMHWTHFDVYSKVVKDAAPCAGGLGYSQDLENFIDLCLIKKEVNCLCCRSLFLSFTRKLSVTLQA